MDALSVLTCLLPAGEELGEDAGPSQLAACEFLLPAVRFVRSIWHRGQRTLSSVSPLLLLTAVARVVLLLTLSWVVL